MPSTDIKDYWRRSWGIGDRQPQKPRLGYVALPLVINPTTIGLVATTLGIAGEAARRYINENPGIVEAAEQGVDKIKEFVSFKTETHIYPSKEVVKVAQDRHGRVHLKIKSLVKNHQKILNGKKG